MVYVSKASPRLWVLSFRKKGFELISSADFGCMFQNHLCKIQTCSVKRFFRTPLNVKSYFERNGVISSLNNENFVGISNSKGTMTRVCE